MGIYRPIAISEIIGRIEHIRDLHRHDRPRTDQGRLLHERREQKLKDFLSNLRRTGARPMVSMVHELEELCGLVTGGGYRLLGYELDAIREYDQVLNGRRTHIVESHVFDRDTRVELPLTFNSESAFAANASLGRLVLRWQGDLPIRVLERPEWRRRGVFYVHVGTEDSLGSTIPPGALAQVELVSEEEAAHPRPTTIYLLQFPNGYRFSRCVATPRRLHLIASEREYHQKEEFAYPSAAVRIVGKALSFALELPQPEYASQSELASFRGAAALLLPWEHKTRATYLETKHRRFVRSEEELRFVKEALRSTMRSEVSERTRRRYRNETGSEPHVDFLIQMVLESVGRYSDVLRAGGQRIRDAHRYSLEALLEAKQYADLTGLRPEAMVPLPENVWESVHGEIGELAPLLLLKFPNLSHLSERLVRIAQRNTLPGLEPPVGSGSWMLLEEVAGMPDLRSEELKRGWRRPLYAARRGMEIAWGYLEWDGRRVALSPRSETAEPMTFDLRDMLDLRRVCGMLVRLP